MVLNSCFYFYLGHLALTDSLRIFAKANINVFWCQNFRTLINKLPVIDHHLNGRNNVPIWVWSDQNKMGWWFDRAQTGFCDCLHFPRYVSAFLSSTSQGRVKDTRYKEEIQEYLCFSAIRIKWAWLFLIDYWSIDYWLNSQFQLGWSPFLILLITD